MQLANDIEAPAGSALSVNHNGDLEYLSREEVELRQTHRDLMDLEAAMDELITNLELV